MQQQQQNTNFACIVQGLHTQRNRFQQGRTHRYMNEHEHGYVVLA